MPIFKVDIDIIFLLALLIKAKIVAYFLARLYKFVLVKSVKKLFTSGTSDLRTYIFQIILGKNQQNYFFYSIFQIYNLPPIQLQNMARTSNFFKTSRHITILIISWGVNFRQTMPQYAKLQPIRMETWDWNYENTESPSCGGCTK